VRTDGVRENCTVMATLRVIKWYEYYDLLSGNINKMMVGFYQLSSFKNGFLKNNNKKKYYDKSIYE
jgi:hypothetical protein